MLSKLNLLDTYTPDECMEHEMDMHQQRQEKEDVKARFSSWLHKVADYFEGGEKDWEF